MRYGMVINLDRCIGCMTCTLACKVENGTGLDVFWCFVKDQEVGVFPEVRRFFLPVQCAHCAEAPCIDVCKAGASYRREDGIVIIDYDKCVKCKYCIDACPYGARYVSNSSESYFGETLTPYERELYRKHKHGVAEKCTFCYHRLDEGKQPACVEGCVGKARIFGDVENPDSEISIVIREKGARQLEKKLKTDPSIWIIMPRKR